MDRFWARVGWCLAVVGDGLVELKDGVEWVRDCRLRVVARHWTFALTHAAAIEAHWQARLKTHPANFNGVVHVMADDATGAGVVADGVFAAELIATDFKSFLYWKDQGYPAAGVRDIFGSAILRSREGHVLLGRQSAGNVNSGLAYLPGGFIDDRDSDAAGVVDIGASIVRELAEETGLGADDAAIVPGYRIVRCGVQVAMAREFRSTLGANALRARIVQHLRSEAEAELADIVIVGSMADVARENVPAYAALALSHVFAR